MYLNNKKSARSHPKAKAFGVSRALFLSYCERVSTADKLSKIGAICFCQARYLSGVPSVPIFEEENPSVFILIKRNAEVVENAAHVAVEPVRW